MRLVELKCKNCGANLKIEEGKEDITCPYCNATYKIDDEVQHVKYDDMENSGYEFEKGRIKAQKENLSNHTFFGKLFIIIFVILFILFIVGSIMVIIKSNNTKNNIFSTHISEIEKKSFNGNFELYSGTVHKMMVNAVLDEVISNNNKNEDKIIVVVYDGIETNKTDEIIKIKEDISNEKLYQVILDYDDNGLVNKITIK